MSESDNFIKVPIFLSVDDRTRHWLYFKAVPRTFEEKQASMHKEDMSGATVSVDQHIYDGRHISKDDNDLTLDKTSFELVNCPTTLKTEEFYKLQSGDEKIQEKYYKEVETLVQKKLGCDKVICVHSQVRNQEKSGDSGVQGYARHGPHTDSSAISGDLFALDIMDQRDEDSTKYKRYCYLNLWRNIGDDPIQDNHLAVLDERTTVKPDDYITKDLFGDGYDVVQYGLNARHASQHKWYYFPQMTKDEGILFKQMDSDWTQTGRVCFHMSVNDPNAPSDAKARESIEVRMLCLWKEAAVDSMPTKENLNRDLIRDPNEFAAELGGSSLVTASLFSLILAILYKLPFVGSFFAYIDIMKYLLNGPSTTKSLYSGKPDDYHNQFVQAVDYYPSWPGFAKNWVKSTMNKSGDKVDEGITIITKVLVDDAMGYQKTKSFAKDQKKEIVDYLLASEKYMGVARKHFENLAATS